jgi:transposase
MTTNLSRTELEQLDKPALIDLILQLADRIAQLEERTRTPPTTSSNSSQPPSQDTKPVQRIPRGRAKHGPKHGHAGTTRAWVETPDAIVLQPVAACGACGSNLTTQPQTVARRHQLIELPPVLAQVIEVHLCSATCPHCGSATLATPPAGLEAERAYGSRLHTVVAYLKHLQHLSYDRLEQLLRDVFGVTLSPGALANILARVGLAAAPASTRIQAQVASAAVIHGDETGSRIAGEKAWHWVFVTSVAVLHLIRSSRGKDIPQAVMGDHQAEVWVCDCWTGQLHAPAATFQLCLAHQVRNLQAVIELQTAESVWAAQVQAIFYNTMRLAHPAHRASVAAVAFAAEWADLERQLDLLLAETIPKGKAQTLRQRYRKHRSHLFVCLARTDVAATNNCAERALRPAVIHRKVTNGFRAQWGADAYAALLSVTDTARVQGHNPFHAILQLMGPSALPVPIP